MRVSIIAFALIATATAQAPTATTDVVAASASASVSSVLASASVSAKASATAAPVPDTPANTYDPAYIDEIMGQGKALWAFLPVSIVGTIASLIPFFRNFDRGIQNEQH
ncbi:UNVERIFIED_CONTAM: hypothetical protein HDU68_011464 [Siphonaria sp. JEL0065]|nr:hypothetical protein HDU68_011464 [Siphonaria sp. JEL0065]